MPFDLKQIDTIVVLMMENRSFDHLLGYLALPGSGGPAVDGLRAGPAAFSNVWKGTTYPSYPLGLSKLSGDPAHERQSVATQLAPRGGGVFAMDGFVADYATVVPDLSPQKRPETMGYHTGEQVPVLDFLARNFAVCDRWFAPVPSGTQPNRLMAMSGVTRIDGNVSFPLPSHDLVYDWLTKHKVRWRVYHDGLPFFALMPEWIPTILGATKFRGFEQLSRDLVDEKNSTFPQVIFIEPKYLDDPLRKEANDDHPPLSVAEGQKFLKEVYDALSSNPERWKRMALIVTYDEHGGFFDHVPPLPIVTDPPEGEDYLSFESTGPRVPALVISPFVEPGAVFHEPLDHTSILKLIADRFGKGKPYSQEVQAREGVGSVSAVFTRETPRPAPQLPSSILMTKKENTLSEAFEAAALATAMFDRAKALKKFPEL